MKIENRLLLRIRICISIMIVGLLISGLTAFPIETELKWLVNHSTSFPFVVAEWFETVYHAIVSTNNIYPYLSYGTDWLAFAHLNLAVLFIGPLKDPVKNIWVIEFGILACLLVVPFVIIAGQARHIPMFWRLIDCSFGILGLIPLLIAYRATVDLRDLQNRTLYV
ncbi:hypothetical protein GS399_12660 [Pedobacter sp. HMF7647]|uniref:Uncharacterized protein n=1 Tax=Hufsiella arboris TaxID=2695275 RepID=A0A7K1YCK3_9SPHI|nr:hypothetical protein [Hufsiella arboris]MXV51829.1 hypothetical protein [Hufsiella arboris]